MTEITFHFNVPDRATYACRLLRIAMRRAAKVAVTGSPDTLARLDRDLWAFDPVEFIPHLLLKPGVDVARRLRATPVLLVDEPMRAGHHDVLVNHGEQAPAGFESFGKLIEIVTVAESERAAARMRWKHYASRGYPITRHEVNE